MASSTLWMSFLIVASVTAYPQKPLDRFTTNPSPTEKAGDGVLLSETVMLATVSYDNAERIKRDAETNTDESTSPLDTTGDTVDPTTSEDTTTSTTEGPGVSSTTTTPPAESSSSGGHGVLITCIVVSIVVIIVLAITCWCLRINS